MLDNMSKSFSSRALYGALLAVGWFGLAASAPAQTKNPDRDARIAMTLEGGYGVFIYTMIPIAFVLVLGSATRSADPKRG